MSIDKRPIYIPVAGPALLESALLNKGSAFSAEERQSFNLEGLIPPVIESIEEQAARAYRQYQTFKTALNKHIYLRNIQDTNETLFYRLVQDHISEMLPMIYTPTVGEACQQFSSIYRRARGLFISYEDRERIDELQLLVILQQSPLVDPPGCLRITRQFPLEPRLPFQVPVDHLVCQRTITLRDLVDQHQIGQAVAAII